MLIILAGAPGAGKGTQADLLVERKGFTKISTGDALRRQIKDQTSIGRRVQEIMARGDLVSDEILLEILHDEFKKAGNHILLDGYPRNVAQSEALDGMSEYPVSKVVQLDVSQDELIARLSGRRVCESCASTYHIKSLPTKDGLKCDNCGGRLVQRPDDEFERVKNRLEIYEKATQPVLARYRAKGKCVSIAGTGTTEEVFERVSKALEGVV